MKRFAAVIFSVFFLFSVSIPAATAAEGDAYTTFGTNGSVICHDGQGTDNDVDDVIIQSDGKILVVWRSYPATGGSAKLFIQRYTSDGKIDTSFGSGGTVTYSPASNSSCKDYEMHTDSGGKILVTGDCSSSGGVFSFLLRYKSDGTLDTTFGTDGVVSNSDMSGGSVLPMNSGKILLVGDGETSATGDAVVLRYNSDGTLDTTFGTNGVVTYTDDRSYDSCWVSDHVLQPDGKIYVLGACKSSSSPIEGSFLLYYNSDGSPDTSFGTKGVIQYDGESYRDIVQLPDGRILLVGNEGNNYNSSRIVLTRLLGPIPADYDGDRDGTADADEPGVASLYTAGDAAVTLKAKGSGETITAATSLPKPASGPSSNTTFPYGLFSFKVNKVGSGQGTTVTIYLPSDTTVNAYYMYGPTPDNTSDHWYKFSYDGTTGAEISGHTITLHFVDGKRGDDDLTADGVITDAGGPAVEAGGLSTGSSGGGGGGGGGCALRQGAPAGPDLVFLLLPLLLIYLAKRRRA
ncbi:MAG: hypothetical protein GXP58_02540 [Deltaproteobacteria bacterium]|nr:hypothetical protein [Deltaproteobacteria bacterium]